MARSGILIVATGPVDGGLAVLGREQAEALEGRQPTSMVVLHRSAGASFPKVVLAALRRCLKARRVMLHFSQWHWPSDRPAVRLALAAAVHACAPGRVVLVLHDSHVGGWSPDRWERLLLRLHLTFSRRVVFLTAAERDRAGPVGAGSRVRVVPSGVRLADRRAHDERPAGDSVNLCAFGFVAERKAPTLAMEAVSLLPPGSTLRFIGRVEAPYTEDELLQAAEDLGVADRVEVTGYVADEDLADHLAAVDVGFAVYRDVASSGSILTLLGHGIPVVAAELPTFRDLAARLPHHVRIVAAVAGEVAAAVEEVRITAGEHPEELGRVLAEQSPERWADRLLEVNGLGQPGT